MNDEPIKRMALLILFQAQHDNATELVVSSSAAAGSPIRCKVGGAWYDFSPPPSQIMPDLVAALGGLAALPDGAFPKEGTIDVPFSGTRLGWKIRMPAADSCELIPIRG